MVGKTAKGLLLLLLIVREHLIQNPKCLKDKRSRRYNRMAAEAVAFSIMHLLAPQLLLQPAAHQNSCLYSRTDSVWF